VNWRDKNVLITGISGFVGPYLAEEILMRGANVFGIIRRRADGSKPKNIADRGIQDNVTFIEGDVTNIYSIAQALDISKPDVVFHLAAQSYIPRSFVNPLETMEVNFLGTENLLEARKTINIKDVKFMLRFVKELMRPAEGREK
jgi:GDPmannose 4,6-dehydratase